jgi:serine/threonine-protein kinase
MVGSRHRPGAKDVNGQTFGPFVVLEKLGEGGMGEVYRGRDTRLNRDVALKVLPDAVALDPERLSRFTREAQVLASLNHPNIASIYGIEHGPDQHALVLELVEGPTLADRLDEGALPTEEALPIARQIAEAIEAAHAAGIIHRDLKPANIKVRRDGTVKVLDFGLAKASDRGTTGSGVSALPDVTASPTLMSPAVTAAGVILGTAAYMSPEQARGREVDHRADIWAFGCVVYEMLAGRRAFDGDVVTDTLASVLRGEPAWDDLPPSTPRAVRRLLRRCLEKDPRNRLQAIGDARIEIADALSRREDAGSRSRSHSSSQEWIFPAVVATVLTAVLVAGTMWLFRPESRSAGGEVTRALLGTDSFDMRRPLADGAARPRLPRPDRTAVALSPDGRTLIYRAFVVDATPNGGTQSQLMIRPLDSLTAQPIDTTTGAETPFLSPSGAWIGYWDAGELRRVPFTTQSDVAFTTITKVPDGARVTGASWGDDEWVVFATASGGLWRAPASGGPPEQIVKVGEKENARILPHVLPGSKAFLFTLQKTAFQWDTAQVLVRSLDGTEKVLLDDAADARYVASGHLVFMRRGKLMAAPFNLDRLEVTGPAVAVVDDVMQAINMPNTTADSGAGQFAVSAQGTLVYVTGGVQRSDPNEIVWVDRATGKQESTGVPPGVFGAPRISPDGRRILMFSGATTGDDASRLWLYDIERKSQTALTSRDERIVWGIWSPDGTRVAYERLDAGRGTLHVIAVNGTGEPERLTDARPAFQTPGSWSRSGTLAYVENAPTTATDIRVLDLSSGTDMIAVQTPNTEGFAEFSSDGKWLAFASDVSGRSEVYVQAYPGSGPRGLVSTGGGTAPAWRRDGSELYYYWVNDGVMHVYAVSMTASGTTMTPGTPRELFSGRFNTTGPARGYDVTGDGSRFLFARNVEQPQVSTQMVLVENWSEELKRQVQ